MPTAVLKSLTFDLAAYKEEIDQLVNDKGCHTPCRESDVDEHICCEFGRNSREVKNFGQAEERTKSFFATKPAVVFGCCH